MYGLDLILKSVYLRLLVNPILALLGKELRKLLNRKKLNFSDYLYLRKDFF
ncbi:hypothetical protein [uncultured Gammaproteobacteria bacterium]|nr:hypothetical protein [uncultured Gammaproteobacteria bacterium]CAC9628273.1 hypothetical protein [uncultured Gammaproteobacteria bacterium]